MENEIITREEAKRRAEAIAKTIPGARVQRHAWGYTVVLKSGRHYITYLGSKKGFKSHLIQR